MAEHPPRPPAPGGKQSIAGAAASSAAGGELHPGWAWGLTLAAILAGGLALYAARSAMGSALDRWLPERQRPEEEAPYEVLAALPEPEGDTVEPAELEWSFVDIEANLRPLPDSTASLIAEGRRELPQFTGLDSTDETRALLIRNRWRMWGRIWSNRVEQIRRPMPPPEACDVHAALEPTCRSIRESLAILDRIPGATNIEDARELLEQASEVLAELRLSAEDPAGP